MKMNNREWEPSDPEGWKDESPSGPMDGESLEELTKKLEEMNKRWREEKEEAKKRDAANGVYYPDTYEHLVEVFEDKEFPDLKFYIVENHTASYLGAGNYNGYVRFPKRPVQEKGYDGILTYVPVHGGITYAEEDDKGMVYGFDCAHFGDEDNPKLNDLQWMRAECRRLARGILIAADYEPQYLQGDGDNEQLLELLQHFYNHVQDHGLPGFDTEEGWNLGVAIKLMGGNL